MSMTEEEIKKFIIKSIPDAKIIIEDLKVMEIIMLPLLFLNYLKIKIKYNNIKWYMILLKVEWVKNYMPLC